MMIGKWNRRRLATTLACSVALPLAYASSAHAAVVTKTLAGFQVVAQEQGNWCSLGAAQMILKYYGANVAQCEMANYDFGRTDCCTYPSSAACNPSTGAFTGTPLSYYGVSWQLTSQLSYAGFVAEIDANRPVSIGYNWNGGGGHALNISGYWYDSPTNQWLWLNDPGSGSSSWITYAEYIGGASPTYNHTAQTPLHHVANAPICASDYVNIPLSQVQQCYDTWTHRGRQPVSFAGTSISGSVYYSGSFQPQTGLGWAQWANQNASQYQAQFNAYAAQGWRPDTVELTLGSSGWQFNSLWRPAEGAFGSWTGMSLATLNAQQSSLSSQGYVPVDLFGYSDSSGVPTFGATWAKNAANGQSFSVNITQATYGTLFNQMAAAGKRPARVSAYKNGSTTNYAILWQYANGGFASYVNNTPANFISQNNSLTSQGYKLRYVSAVNNVFSGVWTNP